MRGKSVYLAGPISGSSYGAAVGWREQAKLLFRRYSGDIEVFSPMRAKEYLHQETNLSALMYPDLNAMGTMKAITARDRFDCMNADVILMYLRGATRVSIGTMIEVGWADAARVPICLVMEKDNVHDHGMVIECASWQVETLEEAVDISAKFLLPATVG